MAARGLLTGNHPGIPDVSGLGQFPVISHSILRGYVRLLRDFFLMVPKMRLRRTIAISPNGLKKNAQIRTEHARFEKS